ncbi:MAG TPA: asparagine synthase-related protein [Candidatus Bathyarchaeia archaeon]|nr:asparagine synthase-related protein [Candidatus Bathyarchaeia archaeon]
MTGICGLIGRESADLESKTKIILPLMRNRGSESQTFSQSVASGERIVLGVCDYNGPRSFDHQAVPLALDGVLFSDDGRTDKGGPAGPGRLIQTPGAFAFLTSLKDQLIAGRDIIGQKPLYFGTTKEGTTAFASLKSPLISIGIREPEPVPPGKVIRAAAGRYETIVDHSLKQPKEEAKSESDATLALDGLLTEAVGRVVPRGSGIAFSGGLDSALVAYIAKSKGLEPTLVSVGLKGQQELAHAERTAKSFGLHVNIGEFSSSEILDSLPEVVDITETTDPTIVGISVPIYFACQRMREMGLSYIAAGQLSDELFGGYGKFEDIALRDGMENLGREMFDSVVSASVKDFDPGDKLAVSAGLELCCPFAYLPLVEYALRLPASLRVNLVDGKVIRKYVLRRVAARLRLPDTVVDRPKKAVQYSSGVQKVLLKEAKRRGISLGKMLESFTR